MFNWMNRLFTGRRTLRPTSPHIGMIAQHHSTVLPNFAGDVAQAEAYTRSPWVYLAVSRIAEAAAMTPLHVYRRTGEQRIAVERHPLEDLLHHPNPFTSRFELLEQTVGFLELTGNAYWYLAGENGTPAQIWPLRPDRVSIVPDERDYIRGYIYAVGGVQVPLEAVEVIHFKRWHPLNDYYGLSALQAAALTIQTDRAMAEWNRNTFGRDNGVPAGVVTVPTMTPDADFKRIQAEWRASYGGTQRKTAFLRAGEVTWQSIAHTHTDLDFLAGRSANRDEILNVFGVPVGLVSDNATEANAKVAERTFIERTLYPKLVRLAAVITADLLPFWEADAVAEFADIRPTDQQARLDEIETAYPVLSVNEIRAQYYHLPPVAWGDVPANIQREAVPLPGVGTQPAAPNTATATDDTPPTDTQAAALDELRAWEKFTLRRLGREDARPFTVRHLPNETAYEVSAGLLAAGDATDAVKGVFREARAMLTQPDGDTGPDDASGP
jgi:HK97 family phage portal protein